MNPIMIYGPCTRASEALENCVYRSLRGYAKVLEKVLGRPALAETMHADEDTVLADHRVPAPADRGLDRHLDGSVADDRLSPFRRLRQEQFERGHRDHPSRDAALGKLLLRVHRDLDFGTRCK